MLKEVMLISIFFLFIFSIGYYFLGDNQIDSQLSSHYKTERVIVSGSSMEPLISAGENLTHITNYYNYNPINRNDIITYNSSQNENLLIKKIVGIPGDIFEYKNSRVYINNKSLQNSQNKVYTINSNMLKLYAENYPEIPKNSYLIMGERIKGTQDSSQFGLVSKKNILGKIELIED